MVFLMFEMAALAVFSLIFYWSNRIVGFKEKRVYLNINRFSLLFISKNFLIEIESFYSISFNPEDLLREEMHTIEGLAKHIKNI